MLHLHSYLVSLSEVPDEISLTLGIYGCPFKCKGCHSPELRQVFKGDDADKKTVLDVQTLGTLIELNQGVSVVTFFGGDTDPHALVDLLTEVRRRGLKTCLYTGARVLPKLLLAHLDFYKVGQYNSVKGPLTSETTNQMFYRRVSDTPEFENITYKFWRTPCPSTR